MEKFLRTLEPRLLWWIKIPIGYSAFRRIFLYYFRFLDWPHASELNSHNFENLSDYLFLPEIFSVKKHILPENKSFFIFLVMVFGLTVLYLSAFFNISIFVIISALITLFYFLLLVFKLVVIKNALSFPLIDFSAEEINAIRNEDLPVYTILIPLLNEAEVIPQIMKAMTAIDYPHDKLDILITLEEYDQETAEAIRKASPLAHFKTVILPNIIPKTKPKALNVAIKESRGEFVVIYDAEIVPETDQLKKAYLAFKNNPEISSLQTRLDHYNLNQNLLTKLFNAEFAFYYDLFLPGLNKFNFPVPLSGHSVHFRKDALIKSGAWDPYNVTEDCDVGIRMHRFGFKTSMINSLSYEEATSTFDGWLKQRTRWMKGFIQTSIVHMRHPLRLKEELGGWMNLFAFSMTVPGTVVLGLLNIVSLTMLLLWLIFRPDFIQSIFPAPVLYISVASFIIGSFIFTYMNLLGIYRRNRYHLVKYILLSPIYWVLLSIATLRAVIQIVNSPYSWEKTKHGNHLDKAENSI